MAIETSVPRSRRALLTGGIAGLVGVVASTLGRPLAARASDPDDVVLGATNTTATTTLVQNTTTTAEPLKGKGLQGDGVVGESAAAGKSGVYGFTTTSDGFGVYGGGPTSWGYLGGDAGARGASSSRYGVHGSSSSGVGVCGDSVSGYGVLGGSDSNIGVCGHSSSGVGVAGDSSATDWPAVLGASAGCTGLLGCSGTSGMPAAPAKTGVYGYSTQDDSANGVYGRSTTGRGVWGAATTGRGVWGSAASGTGVRGYATSGTGGSFEATTGIALRTSGRLRVDKASGVATIAATKSAVTVSPGLDVTSSSFVLLTPRTDPGTRRLWCTTDATANTFTIRASSPVAADVRVGWLLLG